ncbi:hypothetical protein FDP41_007594 [Naegleria fowleri]|uniref:Trimethylguanosine synthase n=1 Tax=Naegleria fowleri TaxID=5763 RepID=A0A6A5CED8_NAEFO|nr:uncharacterized protein FDP41_007594 [Naegleria fowleri]KAF0983679.1 hypothetical protein FDP41_007594 [Naegleria fowleri]
MSLNSTTTRPNTTILLLTSLLLSQGPPHERSLSHWTNILLQKIDNLQKKQSSSNSQEVISRMILQRVEQEMSKSIQLLQQKSLLLSNSKHQIHTISTTTKTSQKSYKIEYFFPSFSKIDQLCYDSQEGLSYLTPHQDAFEIAIILLEKLSYLYNRNSRTFYNSRVQSNNTATTTNNRNHASPSNDISNYPLHIIDGTGGLGGNTIGFLRALWSLYPSQLVSKTRVTMIELDPKRFLDGKHNAQLFVDDYNEKNSNHQRVFKNFHAVNDNFLTWWEEFKVSFKTKNVSSKDEKKKNEEEVHVKGQNDEKNNRGTTSIPPSPPPPLSKTFLFFDPPWGNDDCGQHSVIEDLYFLKPRSECSQQHDPANTTSSGSSSSTSPPPRPSSSSSSSLESSSSSSRESSLLASVKQMTLSLLNEDLVQGVALKVPFNFSESSGELSQHCHVEYVVMKKVKYILALNKKYVNK